MINVTKTFLPPLTEYKKYITKIWKAGWVTNNGPLVLDLEKKLREYLGVKHLFFVSNGTIALQIAIKALRITKEVITTPFSYVASTSAVVWEGCTPVYADIDNEMLCISPDAIESHITPNTEAILGVHVYGNPCDVDAINELAKKYKLKVLYDGAHAFGVRYHDTPLLNYGDISTISFHATKLFHTIEGGAVVTNDDEIAHRISYMRNFGHDGPEAFFGLGINGKNSEFHAAMGLSVLPYIENIIHARKRISEQYSKLLSDTILIKPKIREGTTYNYSYYPVIFPSEDELVRVKLHLNANQIYPRRYFYPSLNTLNYVQNEPGMRAEEVSKRILCLPLFPGLAKTQVNRICKLITESI